MYNNYRVILRIIASILLFEGVAMFIPLIYAIVTDDPSAPAFFLPALTCLCIGLIIQTQLQYHTLKIRQRESYLIAFVCWITVSVMGTFPYLMAGCGYSLTDCIFESVSGWTTTGAWTVDISAMPKALLLWKAITNWLGGMGLLLLTMSFFPVLGVEGQKMVNAEMPGVDKEKFAARSSDAAKIAYAIYVVMSVLEAILLTLSGLDPFTAIVNTMSSISTSGLLPVNGVNVVAISPLITAILTVSTLFGAVNFTVYFLIYKRKWQAIAKNTEVRVFLMTLTTVSIVIGASLYHGGYYQGFMEAWGTAFVQTVAFGATTGFEIANINSWPGIAKMLLICVLIIGGCSNSTSGSIKVIRFIVFIKLIKRGIYKRIHPRAVKPVMFQGKPISASSVSSITVFLMLYFLVFLFGSLVFSLENLDMETTFCTTLACITNNGTAFGDVVGGNFSILSNFSKLFSAMLMIAGRLEMYAIILLFSRSFWNPNRAR